MDDHKIKLLICGDSYMGFDCLHDDERLDHMHWANNLGPEFEVFNYAYPGSTNLQIYRQLVTALAEFKPDCIILGFTASWRVEITEHQSSSHPSAIKDKNFPNFYREWLKYTPTWAEQNRSLIIAQQAIMLAKSQAPTAWVLNLLQVDAEESTWPSVINLIDDQLTMSLINHSEWAADDADGASFHVNDPQIHRQFAHTVRNYFVDLVTKR